VCGIAGIFNRQGEMTELALEDNAQAMAEVQSHRGPDDSGVWVDAQSGIALSHQRLAIIDCSPLGHQPMASACGRYMIAYNGEIYNFRRIAEELSNSGITVKGGSDTAVLLAACATWGVGATVEKCIGMFAFALWDKKNKCVTLVRDRLGIKPLYWGRYGNTFLFGSQLKALMKYHAFDDNVDHDVLINYLRHAYIPAPFTIFNKVRKLEPGTILTIPYSGEPTVERYWDARALAAQGWRSPNKESPLEVEKRLEELLTDAVSQRLISDVPLGAFLSGGVDSSLVVALMQKVSAQPVRSFSIGFYEDQYNEATHAKAVAKHLGTEHTELYVTSDQALNLIPKLPAWYDEPFADSSQLPTLLLSKMTRKYVTVALSGDGGDEVFAGYNRYFWTNRIWKAMHPFPRSFRSAGKAMMTAVSPENWDRISQMIPSKFSSPQFGDKVHKLAGIVDANDLNTIYRRLVSQWPHPEKIVPSASEHQGILWDETISQDRPDSVGRMQLLDMLTYLPDDILTKVDRASMAYSLEARVPLLDHRIVEFAWALPRSLLVQKGAGKNILRNILYQHVPKDLIERPKMGFGAPIGHWLRGPLQDWAESLLSEKRLKEDGYFNPGPIRTAWRQHLSGTRNHQYALWAILMFQSWHDHWLSNK